MDIAGSGTGSGTGSGSATGTGRAVRSSRNIASSASSRSNRSRCRQPDANSRTPPTSRMITSNSTRAG
jgi:hypothetical protein